MGENIDKLKAAEEVVALAAIERVKDYFRTINGKKVKITGHTRKGDGPNHRADMNVADRMAGQQRPDAVEKSFPDKRPASKTASLVDHYAGKANGTDEPSLKVLKIQGATRKLKAAHPEWSKEQLDAALSKVFASLNVAEDKASATGLKKKNKADKKDSKKYGNYYA